MLSQERAFAVLLPKSDGLDDLEPWLTNGFIVAGSKRLQVELTTYDGTSKASRSRIWEPQPCSPSAPLVSNVNPQLDTFLIDLATARPTQRDCASQMNEMRWMMNEKT
jgi:hypothetical protein